MINLNRLSTGLFWGIPTLGRPIPLEWALSFKAMNPPINFNVQFATVVGLEVAVARNQLAKAAIAAGCKYLFFHGDDTVPPNHAIKQLIYRMENQPNCGVVGGVYCSKSDPAAPLVFMGNGQGSYWDWKIGEFFECSGLGMDCTLVRVELFSQLSEPWFKTVDNDSYLDGINAAEQWTEDLFFCKKVLEETPWKIYCDTSVLCDHWDVYNRKIYRLPVDSYPRRQLVVTSGRKKVLILGPKLALVEDHEMVWMTDDEDPSADYRGQISQTPFADGEFDWVIVTKPQSNITDLLVHRDEWLRISKERLSINLGPSFDKEFVANVLKGKVDGTFVDLMK